jgi:hypothetical protein
MAFGISVIEVIDAVIISMASKYSCIHVLLKLCYCRF